ncbi:glycosyl hydrolase family 18 protein [Jiangella asiatica]|nr:glycosyl hydrolase family 18 protein [Jiangella asiatica]
MGATGTMERERHLDVYRAVALLGVMAYHLAGWAWQSIVFPAMGVIFAVAGSLVARSLERAPAFDVIAQGLRRLLPPLWLLGAVVVPAMLWRGWDADGDTVPVPWDELVYWIVPVLDPPASAWAAGATEPLWYVRAYLWFVVLSPVLMWAFRRWPVPTVLAPIAVIVLSAAGPLELDAWGTPGDGLLDFATFGACWLLGFAYRSGGLRRLHLAIAATLAAAGMAAGLGWALTQAAPEFGNDLYKIPVAQALWSVGAVLLLMRWSPRPDGVDRVPLLGRLVDFMTARVVTLYLWHGIAIVLAVGLCADLGVPALGAVALLAAALTVLATVLFGWAEDVAAGRPVRLLPGLVHTTSVSRRPAWSRGVAAVFSRFGVAVLVALLITSWAAIPATSPDEPPERTWTVGAYLAPWDQQRGLASLQVASDVLTSVSPVWYTPTDAGGLTRNQESETDDVRDQAWALGLEVIPSISNFRDDQWDGALVHELVADPRRRAGHVQAIVDTVHANSWDGIDVDYEALAPQDYEAFGVFLHELADALHDQGRRLTAALPAATTDDPPGLARLYELAGAAVDEVRVMAYDHAWAGSEPGPIAPVGWVDDVVRFAVRHIPEDRVILGLAAHGYDWGAAGDDGARSVMFADAMAVAERHDSVVQWDTDAQVPWFTYPGAQNEHAVWFEDAPSLAAKLDVATEHDLGGVFVWRLGGEDPTLWRVLGTGRQP